MSRSRPDAEVTVLEKESAPSLHQTGRNSGVIHSGIYYTPGSAKAVNCRQGRQLLLEFCQEFSVQHKLCGKVIVATEPDELSRLYDIFERGQANGVDCRLLSSEELSEVEPHARGLEAIWVADAGIVDYRAVSQVLASQLSGSLVTSAEVLIVEEDAKGVRLETTAGVFEADLVVNCGGLHCDRICRLSGAEPGLQIVPFKGEYFRLKEGAEHLCNTLIYPVPDPRFPFLGVHLTSMIHGGVEVGPNAILALGREAYKKTDLNLSDLIETLTYPGFLKLSAKHWKMGLEEWKRSLSKRAFVAALNKLCPALEESDLLPAPSGIRAQALHRDGSLEDDFRIIDHGRMVHVLNAPSPAATSSLSIGKTIAERVLEQG